MSGTSRDGLDAVLVELDEQSCLLQEAQTTPLPDMVAEALERIVEELTAISASLAHCTRASVSSPLTAFGSCWPNRTPASAVNAIGFSGHTAFHQPDPPDVFTLQIGDANVVAARTAITTVADFRGMDVAAGGQGAPLLPAFHSWRFSEPTESRIVLNVGGIANLTCLVPEQPVEGFDSGPGNALMDAWCRRHGRGPYDVDGAWASSGPVDSKPVTCHP